MPIDARGRVFLPAAARALLQIAVDDRLVLAAAPHDDRLIVIPARIAASLLAQANVTRLDRY